MKWLLITILLCGCGGPSYFDNTITADTEPEISFKQDIKITFHWETLNEIQARAKFEGYERWEGVYGLAYPLGYKCDVYVEIPENYNDVFRLYIIGHEMLHCWGWENHYD